MADDRVVKPNEERTLLAAKPWVSVDDITKHLGVAKDSVYRWIEQKGLPAHRVGRLWKFKLSEIDEWVHAGGAGPEESDKKEPTR